MARDQDISITEKTFDLSLEDTDIDDEDEQRILDSSIPNHSLPISSQILPSRDDSNHQVQLHKCLEILQRISGTEMTKINLGDCDSDELSKMILELCENSELKLQFYERNYKFLENLYETVQRDYEMVKKREKMLKIELERLKVKSRDYDLLRKTIQEKDPGNNNNNNNPSIEELCQIIDTLKTPDSSQEKDITIIKRQEKEIKEYKRFIRELMDR